MLQWSVLAKTLYHLRNLTFWSVRPMMTSFMRHQAGKKLDLFRVYMRSILIRPRNRPRPNASS